VNQPPNKRKGENVPRRGEASGLSFLLLDTGRRLAPKEGVDELIDFTIDDCLHVCCLVACSDILDHLIGMKDIVADLVAPRGVDYVSSNLIDLLNTLLLRYDY